MQIPSIVKKMGNVTDENRVYIEDYVFSYLNRIKEECKQFPVRMALYGHACYKEGRKNYLIYGASCVVEELQQGREQSEVQEKYFSEYSLIGYVNVYPKKELAEPGGYFVFYESNEAMQRYLVSCYERKQRKEDRAGSNKKMNEGRADNRKTKALWNQTKAQEGKDFYAVLLRSFFEKLLLCFLVALAAVSVSTINEYGRLQDFSIVAEQAIEAAGRMG